MMLEEIYRKVPNWKTLIQDRRRWKELVEKVNTLHKELYSHYNKKKIFINLFYITDFNI
jgi:hypothetical protein